MAGERELRIRAAFERIGVGSKIRITGRNTSVLDERRYEKLPCKVARIMPPHDPDNDDMVWYVKVEANGRSLWFKYADVEEVKHK